jgi:TatD DNase family protein
MIDTHAHIHFEEYAGDIAEVFANARKNSVDSIITVGTNDEDSRRALEFVSDQTVLKQAGGIKLYATVGLHPHDANKGSDALLTIEDLVDGQDLSTKPVAIGECGLDYFKNHSTKSEQRAALEFQLELAAQQDLPLIFHVRDAWDDFFDVLGNYKSGRGVIHSITGTAKEVELASKHGLYFGLNGIMTFTKEAAQLEAAKVIPADRLLLETDCPFLSPLPVRGKRNQPANLVYIAAFLADLRGESLESLVAHTNHNAKELFRV